MNSWFRLWAEFEDDPKVQMMPEEMQRRLVLLFCERCKGERRTEQQRAFKMHLTIAQLRETKACFIEAGIIDEKWELVNWNKRQFLSDSSTDRVKRHRANQSLKQSETLHETGVKQSVTPPDTDTDSDSEADTEQKQKEQKPSAKGGPSLVVLPDWIRQETWDAFEHMRKRIKKPLTDEAIKRILSRLEKWREQGQDVEEILSMAIENNWQGLWPIEKNGGSNGNHGPKGKGHGALEAAKQAVQNMVDREARGDSDGPAGDGGFTDARILRGDVGGVGPAGSVGSDLLFLPQRTGNR